MLSGAFHPTPPIVGLGMVFAAELTTVFKQKAEIKNTKP
jgi:hypothetical protein